MNRKAGIKKGSTNLSIGIVGLPNVGKSTLFNALTNISVPAENYPFCTIEPNVGIVPVPDDRLGDLVAIDNPKKTINAVVKFVDIAGLVKGASQGEGLGNQFLANIREVDAIVQVVRFFENENVIHVNNRVNPKDDIEIIETELGLKDLEVIEKRLAGLAKQVRTAKKEDPAMIEYYALEKVRTAIEDGASARDVELSDEAYGLLQNLGLLTLKPIIYVFNTNDLNADTKELKRIANVGESESAIMMDIKLEAELSEMSDEDRDLFKEEFGVKESGLERLTKECYTLLGLQSFFTSGKDETRAWTINIGETAPEAGGRIHGDFEAKFICAEVVSYSDYIAYKGWHGAKENGKLRLEGKGYVVQSGDVIVFRHGA